jgi:hypothetical protein
MDYRALQRIDELPAWWALFAISDDDAAPHMQRGEFAVVDTTDRDLQHGELFIRKSGGVHRYSEARRYLFEARRSFEDTTGSGVEEEVWWFAPPFFRPRSFDELVGAQAAGRRSLLTDGPMLKSGAEECIVGRVVGFATAAIGPVLPAIGEAPARL